MMLIRLMSQLESRRSYEVCLLESAEQPLATEDVRF